MYAKFWKRFFDFFIALFALILLLPLLIILAVVGAIAMGGNPFFVQKSLCETVENVEKDSTVLTKALKNSKIKGYICISPRDANLEEKR